MREHSNTAEWHILKCPQVFNGPKPARINHFDRLTQNTEKKKCCTSQNVFVFYFFFSFILITSRSLCEQFDWRSVDGSKTLSRLDGCVLYAHAVYHALPGLCMGFIYDNWVIKTLCSSLLYWDAKIVKDAVAYTHLYGLLVRWSVL